MSLAHKESHFASMPPVSHATVLKLKKKATDRTSSCGVHTCVLYTLIIARLKPQELLGHVYSYLDLHDVMVGVHGVSKHWRDTPTRLP